MDAIDPVEVIKQRFTIDQIAGVRLACEWVDSDDSTITDNHRDAAHAIFMIQTVYPKCRYCTMPIIEGEEKRHEDCNTILAPIFEATNCGDEDEDWDDDYSDDEDDYLPTSMIADRARRHFGGDTEQAREAMSLYPGDFI